MFFTLPMLNLEKLLGKVIIPHFPLSANYITRQARCRSLSPRFDASTVTGTDVEQDLLIHSHVIPDKLFILFEFSNSPRIPGVLINTYSVPERGG
jgi:hypothetical protein